MHKIFLEWILRPCPYVHKNYFLDNAFPPGFVLLCTHKQHNKSLKMELLDDSLQSEETQKCPFQYLGFLHTVHVYQCL